MIASFWTSVILSELDPLLLNLRFYRLPKTFVIKYITKICIAEMLLFLFPEKIGVVVSSDFICTPIFMISILIKVIF